MISTVIETGSSLLKLAHGLIGEGVKSGDIVIDATVGNGHDTLFLLNLVKSHGRVFGFDIQREAIESAQGLIGNNEYKDRVIWRVASHADMAAHVSPEYVGMIKAVMFNLGYLPGGDKTIITAASATIKALSAASGLLAKDGMLSIMAYPGHEGGRGEAEKVEEWCLSLNPACFEARLYLNRPKNPAAPRLLFVRKIA